MKYTRTLRIFGIAIILSMMMAFMMLSPAQAARSIKLEPAIGNIGDTITVTGSGFSASTYIDIYLTANGNSTSYEIGNQVKTYEKVKTRVRIEKDGDFETTLDIPKALNDGSSDKDVKVGTTYYVCATREYTSTASPSVRIGAYAKFTVTEGEISLSPGKGTVDTLVEITGSKFGSKKDIAIEYDESKIKIEDGDSKTDSNGKFESLVYIPESTAGTHTITVIINSSEVEATFTVEPEILLSTQSGHAGTEVTVSGTGFGKRKEVEIWFNDNIGVATAITGGTGSFTAKFNVPTGPGAGSYNVDAEDGNNVARAKFTGTVPPSPTPEPTPTPSPVQASLTLSQDTGSIGTSLTLAGTGFQPNATVTVRYDDEIVATATTETSGIFASALQIPLSQHGEHTITATDGTNNSKVTFIVESVAPATPSLLLPKTGDKAESPFSFDWSDVTDESLPVTYILQIAAEKDFKTASVILEKVELAKSEYTLTGKEELNLAGKKTPYYWRVKAIDAAFNEGQWAGAREFYIATPFAFPNWAKYTLLGIGAVVLFVIGYWLGRRTAFYY